MPSNVPPSSKYLESAADMRSSSSESKQRSKQQQSSKMVKEGVSSQRENNSLKYQSKLKIKPCVAPPYSDQPHEQRREADGKLLLLPKSSGKFHGQCSLGKAKKDDELVKYMSNLPSYLKRVDGEENSQDKAFNVGVLDWARLEQWKYKQNCNHARGTNNGASTSSSLSLKTTVKSSSFSSAAQGGTRAHQSEQHRSLCPGLNSFSKDSPSQGVQLPTKKAVHFQDFESSSKGNLGKRKTQWTYKPFAKNDPDVALQSEKTKVSAQKITSDMRNSSTNLKHNGVALSPKEKPTARYGEVKKSVEVSQESDKKRASNHKIISEAKAYPKLRTSGVSHSSKEKIDRGNFETTKRVDKFQESNIDLSHQNLPGKLENVVLLLPREFSQKGSLEEPKVLLNEHLMETNQNSLSGSFPLEKICSAELHSDIPHSCPLPSKVETEVQKYFVSHSRNNSTKLELTSNASHKSPCSNKTFGMFLEGTEQKTIKHMKANSIGNLKILDQEMAEMAAMKGRSPSPNRRFSFSLGRMGRSLSLKEGSNVPQLSSTYVSVKSGPVKSEVPVDDSNRERAKGHNRPRSSPLRRMLDPLLRSKGRSNPVQEPGSFQPCKESLSHFSSRPINGNETLPKQRHEASKIHALLQLSIKNGIPLFKFVVDNNSTVLAATMKNLTSPGKDDLGENYTFYSVNEIKKKSGGWINQGSKVKSCGYVYNVVGQMKVSSSHYPDSEFKNQYIMGESVLFGVEVRQADQASPQLMTSKELAAIVVKLPIESLSSHQAKNRNNDTFEKGFIEHLPGGGCTTVILPGGIHSLPSKGAPTSLIQRWKSGGLCDCGGWDVGCKLRVLASHDQSSKMLTASNAFPDSAPFELFAQGEEPQEKPVFSLVPLNKEIYSVEFNSSVPLLQAFFICVTVISRQKSSDLSGISNSYETKVFQEEPEPGMNGDETKKNHPANIILGELPGKYAPNPPLSPVGRV